jgi:RNA polymerase sigma factor (TIGR02999 family)
MATSPPGSVTKLLADLQQGFPRAEAQLWERIYGELRVLAQGLMGKERPGHLLQPTALVHEVFPWLRDVALNPGCNRVHLFAAATRAMGHVLVDYARRRQAMIHGGGWRRTPLFDDLLDHYANQRIDLVALHDALDRLRTLHPRQYLIVETLHFGGFTMREIAGHLGVSEATVSNDFKRAKLWLAIRLGEGESQ